MVITNAHCSPFRTSLLHFSHLICNTLSSSGPEQIQDRLHSHLDLKSLPIQKNPLTAFDRPELSRFLAHATSAGKRVEASFNAHTSQHTLTHFSVSHSQTHHTHSTHPSKNPTGHSHEVPTLYSAVGGKRYGYILQVPPSRWPLYPLWWAMDGWMDAMSWLHRLSDPGSASLRNFVPGLAPHAWVPLVNLSNYTL